MELRLPLAAVEIIRQMNTRGYAAHAVGGCVRDLLRGATPHDIDICTSARPEETLACFEGERLLTTGLKHGTVTLIRQGIPYEITTYRTDGIYLDGRHPEQVSFTPSLSEDLRRRDFTVNAMAYSPRDGLTDLFDGQKDLQNKIIRCVGDADTRFTEDALRILRAQRFASELNFKIEDETLAAMHRLSSRLSLISRERVAMELFRALCGKNAIPVFEKTADILLAALPDYPGNAVWNGINALNDLPNDLILRLAAFLSPCKDKYEAILRSLKPSNAVFAQVSALISALSEPVTNKQMPLLLADMGEEQLRRLLILQRNETLLNVLPDIVAQKLPLRLADLAVNANDLIRLGIPAGPELGKILRMLHCAVLTGEVTNERETLEIKARLIQ